MTREEAKSCICTIKMLQRLAYNIHGVMDVVDADNCKKIIKALEQEPCEDKRLYIKVFADLEPDDIAEKIYQICDEDKFPKVIESLKEYFDYETCEDCVSREQLNKLYNKYRPYLATRVCEFGEKLKELPSVKPAADNNVLTCEDCISRRAAIDCLNADFTIDGKENMETVVDYINGAFKKIKALPSIAPHPKVGHWIETAEEYYKAVNEKGGGVDENTPYFTDDIACSECLAKYSVIDNETQFFKCCPNCGARTEGKE